MIQTNKTKMHENLPLSNNAFPYKKTTHFHNMVENTNEFQKYTEEQYEADLQKWFNDTSYTKRQTNWTEKYAHEFKQWSGEIKNSKIYSEISTPANISIQKTAIISATPINTENLDITEMIEILQSKT
jgi:hypothetical protein